MSRKKIWLVLDSGNIGGIETHVTLLATYLLNKGHKVQVIFLNDYSNLPVPLEMKALDIPLVFLDGRLTSLIKALRKESPDIIHGHGYKPGVLCKLIGRCLGISVVCTHHPGERGKGKIYFYNFLDENLAFLANHSIAVSSMILQRLFTKRKKVIPNFVHTSLTLENKSMPDLSKHIGFIGRFHYEKGPDLFCQLSQYLPEGLQLDMYGCGDLLEPLKLQYKRRVFFHGEVRQVNKPFAKLDLLCLTSRSEGLPLVALEAMALGVVVVSFAVGAMVDLIRSGENGYLVPPGDVESFAATVSNYYSLPASQQTKIKQLAHQTVYEHYSDIALGPQIEALYSNLNVVKS